MPAIMGGDARIQEKFQDKEYITQVEEMFREKFLENLGVSVYLFISIHQGHSPEIRFFAKVFVPPKRFISSNFYFFSNECPDLCRHRPGSRAFISEKIKVARNEKRKNYTSFLIIKI